MDATLAGLVQGCAEALEDNGPRLILADWLEDHDQPERAELVRLQCRLADWVPDWQERQSLIARQDQLLAEHRALWLGPLTEPGYHIEFVRGLCRLNVSGRTLASRAFREWLNAHNPTALVEQVRLDNCQALKQIASRRGLEQIPALVLGLNTQTADVEPLWQSPTTQRLVSLDLSNNFLEADALDRLLASPLFGRLARLALRNSNLPERGSAALLAHAPATLRDLDLAGNELTPALIERLAARLPAGRRMNALGMEFVRIPAGSFLMGSIQGTAGTKKHQYPQHPVTLTKSFWLGRFPVTQEQYLAVMGSNPAHFAGPRTLPVENVNHGEAEEFCRRLARHPYRTDAQSYRLPTEAEWEHACRAGTFTAYFFGEAPSLRWMNYAGDATSEPVLSRPRRPRPVGAYPPNAFGLYEMHGNVWERIGDFYAGDYSNHGNIDPTGPDQGDFHPVRGGCWDAHPNCCRSAHRYGEHSTRRDRFTGFRVVLVTAE